jgi:NCS1 family nucleobase:cation symporter-1
LTCGALAIAGPLAVIKLALERVATWVLLLAFGILTMWLLVHGLGDTSGSSDAAPFAVAVDLVVAMPVSWLSVVNDYNRFSVNRRSNFVGTFSGTLLGNTWLYVLGALLVLSGRLTDASPAGIAVGVLGVGAGTVIGLLMLCSLLAGEAPNAFADIYSAVVSTQNLTRRVSYRLGVIVTVVIAAAIAAVATVSGFESFLFLLGSVFVPLFAVVLADALTSRPRMSPQGTEPGVRWRSCAAWSGGFAAYQWIVPTGPARWVSWVTGHVPGAGDHATFGASLPSFAIAFALAAATMRHRNDTDAPEHAATVHPPPH